LACSPAPSWGMIKPRNAARELDTLASRYALQLPPPFVLSDDTEVEVNLINVPRTHNVVLDYFLPGSLWPLFANACPNLVRGPPPAGFTWHRPHGSPVCCA